MELFAPIQRVSLLCYKLYSINLGYKPPEDSGQEKYQSIPLNKIEDFGVHCKNYYSLNISYFKSSLDSTILNSMWTTYWKNTLTSDPLRANSEYLTSQVTDLAAKLEQVCLFNKLLYFFVFRLETRIRRCSRNVSRKQSRMVKSWAAKLFRV